MKVSIFTSSCLDNLEDMLNEHLKDVHESSYVGMKMLYEPGYRDEEGSISEQWTVMVIEKGAKE